MIWMADNEGLVRYISPEWLRVTGLEADAALGEGWQAAVHPDDLPQCRAIFGSALRAQNAFTMRYRTRLRDGAFQWVVTGAVPSIAPPEEVFIGFMGSVSFLPPVTVPEHATGHVGSFKPLPAEGTSQPGDSLDLITDHLLSAHALAEVDGGKMALPFIKSALLRIGIELASQMPTGDGRKIH